MEKALQVAASGMLAQKLNIDVIANNLANVNTTGFSRVPSPRPAIRWI